MMSVAKTASPRAEMRMLVGYVLLSPVCGLLMYVTISVLSALGFGPFSRSLSPDAALAEALAVTVFAAPIATIFGAVPTVAWLIRRGRLTLRNLLIAGIALGNLPILILMTLMILEKVRNGTLSELSPVALVGPALIGACFGGWAALFFWFVSIRGTALDQRSSN